MSKFLALGMSLEDVLTCTTITPSGIAGFEESKEEFEVGERATFTIFEIKRGQFNFTDTHGHDFLGEIQINPVLTLHDGEVISNNLSQNNES